MEEKLQKQYQEKILSLQKEIQDLKEENKKFKERKKYGLVWDNEKNKERIVEDCKNRLPILERVKEKEIITDKSKPMNIMIEGDNYHALTCLNYTHRGKIDVIYIDPPYNTGKTDEWKYNDRFVDKEDTYRHSKWINMMSSRLKLAKNLLKDDGVIFISIDDNEQANLKILCDEIFGEENFINNFMWLIGKGKKTKQSRTLQQYNLSYSKNKILLEEWIDYKLAQGDFSNPDNDPNGEWFSGSISFDEQRSNKEHENYFSITSPSGIVWERQFQCSKEEMEDYLMNGKIYFGPHPEYKNVPRLKIYPNDIKEIIPDNFCDVGSTRAAQKELDDIIGKIGVKSKFENPKPTKLINYFIKIISKEKNIIILDFFAGSGTTGHAVIELNKEDGGNRQFILCTNDEGNIASEICYPRIKKVIEGYVNSKSKRIEGLGGNLHYFKADVNSFISVDTIKNISDDKKLELTLKAGELIAIKENIFDEIDHTDYWQIFEDAQKQIAIYFTEDISKLRKLLKKLNINKKCVIYIFSWGKKSLSGADMGFENIEIKDIPQPIINIYREIYRG